MNERRERDFGEGHAGIIIPVTVHLDHSRRDFELDRDEFSTYCSHCGRRVSRRAVRGIHYLGLDELWCYACVRSAMMQASQGAARYISWGTSSGQGIDRLDMPIAPSTDEEFDEVFHHRPQFTAGLDLASSRYEHIVLQAPRGQGRATMQDLISEWFRAYGSRERTVVD